MSWWAPAGQGEERGSLERALGNGQVGKLYHQTTFSAGSMGFRAWENAEFQFPGIWLVSFGDTGRLGLRELIGRPSANCKQEKIKPIPQNHKGDWLIQKCLITEYEEHSFPFLSAADSYFKCQGRSCKLVWITRKLPASSPNGKESIF